MILIFHGNDKISHDNFQAWRKANVDGFHMTEGTIGHFKVHYAQDSRENSDGRGCRHQGCSYIKYLEHDNSCYTKARKVCSNSLSELRAWAKERSVNVKHCKHCDTKRFPFPSTLHASVDQQESDGGGSDELEAQARRGSSQGFLPDSELKKQLEMHGMSRAASYFESLGYDVDKSPHKTKPYDLLCTTKTEKLHVEVKATTTSGDKVLVTKNEVEFARTNKTEMALCVVHSIVVTPGPEGFELTGGEIMVRLPWDIDDGELTPINYFWSARPSE